MPFLAPTDLPIENHIDEVRSALAQSGQGVLQAEPGAGKTTIVPIRLLDEPWLAGRRIIVLEPRRVAARAAARRMASLLGEQVGETVGYRTRDDRLVGPDTRIEVITEGILTAWLQGNPALPDIGLICFDEFHERSLPGDIGLALALHARENHELTARLLVMSATIDHQRIAAFLGGSGQPAPVIASDGRTFPIDVRWRPMKKRERIVPAVAQTVMATLTEPGDILVFLPGVGEITGVKEILDDQLDNTEVVVTPLHGSLLAAEQDAAIVEDPYRRRRIVLATDVAETSLTVHGVRIVIDSGLARQPRFQPGSGRTQLTTVSTSKASADQRAGRAGRTEPGIAIRMWSKLEHGTRSAHRTPIITQVDVADLVLDFRLRDIDSPADIAMLDRPSPKTWQQGVELVTRLGALNLDGTVSERGRAIAALPLHPRLARMVVGDRDPWLACVVATLLDERDLLRGRPTELPADLSTRLTELHQSPHLRSVERIWERASDLARRAGITKTPINTAQLGAVVAQGYPDRIARAAPNRRHQFTLLDSTTAAVTRDDSLADARGLVVIEIGGRRNGTRIVKAARLEAAIDHLVYATPDLAATLTTARSEWGLEPVPGGRHPHWGTANYLVGLGQGAYLEIIGPDPDSAEPDLPRPFGIDDLEAAALQSWALRVPDIDAWVSWADKRGLNPGLVHDGQRLTAEGEQLRWQMTSPPSDPSDLLPFLVQWPSGLAPGDRLEPQAEIFNFELAHPQRAIADRLAEHAGPVTMVQGDWKRLLTLFAPSGLVELSGTTPEPTQ